MLKRVSVRERKQREGRFLFEGGFLDGVKEGFYRGLDVMAPKRFCFFLVALAPALCIKDTEYREKSITNELMIFIRM